MVDVRSVLVEAKYVLRVRNQPEGSAGSFTPGGVVVFDHVATRPAALRRLKLGRRVARFQAAIVVRGRG